MAEMMMPLNPFEISYLQQLVTRLGRMKAARHVNISYPTFLRLITTPTPRLGMSAYDRLEERMRADLAQGGGELPPLPPPTCELCGRPPEPDLDRRCLDCTVVEEHLPRMLATVAGQRRVIHALQDARKL